MQIEQHFRTIIGARILIYLHTHRHLYSHILFGKALQAFYIFQKQARKKILKKKNRCTNFTGCCLSSSVCASERVCV